MERSRRPFGLATLLAIGLALLTLTQFGGPVRTARVDAQATTSVQVLTSGGTQYLADPTGRTLYVFSADSVGAGTSACNGACSTPWPPFAPPSDTLTAPDGVTGTLATFQRQDGSSQVTYGGAPLYMFSSDQKQGDTNGQGITAFGGTWTLAMP